MYSRDNLGTRGEPTVSLQNRYRRNGDNRVTNSPGAGKSLPCPGKPETGTRNTGGAQGTGEIGTTEITGTGFWQS